MAKAQCPICKRTDVTQEQCPEGRDSIRVHCPNCKTYEISGTALVALSSHLQNTRLSFAIRERTLNGKEYVRINSKNYNQLTEGIDFPITIQEKAELVLKIVFKDEKASIHGFNLSDNNRVIFNIESTNQMNLAIKFIDGKGWFDMTKYSTGGALLSITGKGIEYAESILSPTLNSDQVFVAMSFNEDLAGVYEEGIKKAIEECDLIPCRIDRREFNEEIFSKIHDRITKSRFIIADFTDNKAGVYLEAGYAAGKKIPVIYCCRKSDEGHIHFDIKHFNFIMWNDIQELKDRLVKRISGTGLRN